MKSLFKIVLLLVVTFTFLACPQDDSSSSSKIKDYQEVYDLNIVEIEDYLKSNYLVLDADNNATVYEIPEGGTETSIWDQYSQDGGLTFPSITVKTDARLFNSTEGASKDPVDYKMYYIKLNQGGGATPVQVDSTLVGYKGWNLKNEIFDQNNTGMWFSFPDSNASISGFRQILSTIQSATSRVENPDGTVTHVNSGNTIVFIPSGLAYFNQSRPYIDTYSAIAFQVKLYDVKERDHDKDRILSKYEDINNDGDFFNDDTDGDKVPDFLDIDDDGDGRITKFEIRIPSSSNPYLYYDFLSIPNCNSSGIKVHLNKDCR